MFMLCSVHVDALVMSAESDLGCFDEVTLLL